jgi:UDPglucose 6-dehydrogenase
MRITIIGVGYVGLVTGACFADMGNRIVCADVDKKKIQLLSKGTIPIFEPGLEEIVRRNLNHRLFFTNNIGHAVRESDFIFIAVGTPSKQNGQVDISYIEKAARVIAAHLDQYKVIVNKSTVPIGMGYLVARIIQKYSTGQTPFDVVSNPEFLREGSAVKDLLKPHRVVIGADRREIAQKVSEIYEPLHCPILLTDLKSAEMIKYASNAFLACKISFINEIANMCDQVGADIHQVTQGIALDPRIGDQFLNAGLGFGGSCFPKDVSALIQMGKKHGYQFKILPEILEVNQFQRKWFISKVKQTLGVLKGKTIAIWGISFKPDTDDLREAPSLEIIPALQKAGAHVKLYDPVCTLAAKQIFKNVQVCKTAYEAAKNADALGLLTDWNEFKQIDFKYLKSILKSPIIIDGRNIYDPHEMLENQFIYQGMGQGTRLYSLDQ